MSSEETKEEIDTMINNLDKKDDEENEIDDQIIARVRSDIENSFKGKIPENLDELIKKYYKEFKNSNHDKKIKEAIERVRKNASEEQKVVNANSTNNVNSNNNIIQLNTESDDDKEKDDGRDME